jgi:hypothetical protein
MWSAEGFSIDNSELVWIGIGLALSVTAAELLFNRGSANPTIFLVGLAAYIYGFATNFLGISIVVGINFSDFSTSPLKIVAGSLGIAALALIVEAAPESFILWSIYPEEKSPGDFISALLSRKTVFGHPNKPSSTPQHTNSPYSGNFERSNTSSIPVERSTVSKALLEHAEQFQNVPELKRSVREYVQKYKAKNNGKTPSYREIVQNTPLTSTSQVSQYLKP